MDDINTTYWPIWQRNRLNWLLRHFGRSFFKGKSVLELGPMNGFFGAAMCRLGAQLTGLEGRQENISVIRREFPDYADLRLFDLDTDTWPHGKYDIIINFGVLYHLEHHHKRFLINCINNCQYMFLESVVFDSPHDEFYWRDEAGPDQSLSGRAGTPSTLCVENILRFAGASFERFDDPRLNAGHHYDWVGKNDRSFDQCARRFWITLTPGR